MHGTAAPLASRLPRIGQAYAMPAADARKAVICTTAPIAPATAGPAVPPMTQANSAER